MDNVIKALCEFPSINADDELLIANIAALIKPELVKNSLIHPDNLISLELKAYETCLNYVHHWHHIAHITAAHFDYLDKYLKEIKSPTLAADILLPLVIELLPNDELQLKAALDKLNAAMLIDLSGKVGYQFVTLESAITFKLTKEKNDPSIELLAQHFEPIKKGQSEIAIKDNDDVAKKIENGLHQYSIKWLTHQWQKYQENENQFLFNKLKKLNKYPTELQDIQQLDAYIFQYSPEFYKESILPNEINHYFIVNDMMLTLQRVSKNFTYVDLLTEFNEKLLHHYHLFKDDVIIKLVKANLKQINIGEHYIEAPKKSFRDYLPDISFKFFNRGSEKNLKDEEKPAIGMTQ